MKIYVIAWSYAYEGYGEPLKAFATREAAEEAIKGQGDKYEEPEIFDVEVEGALWVTPEELTEHVFRTLKDAARQEEVEQ